MPKVIGQQDFRKIPVKGLVVESSGTQPSNSVAGEFWYDTTNSKTKFTNDGSTYVDPLARANHSGTQLANTISNFSTAVAAISLSSLAAAAAPVDFGNQRGQNVASPISAQDLANKQYVDDSRAGISVKDPVRVVAQTSVDLSAPGTAIDGVTMTSGDRFLAPLQVTGTQNGIYVFSGSATAAVRSTDADTTGEIVDGSMTAVAEGTDAGAQYIQRATPAGNPGTWTQDWAKYSTGGQTYSAGNGLQLDTNSFSVKLDGTSLAVGSNGVKVNLVPLANGGTGATTAAAARTALGAVAKYAADMPALIAGSPSTVTHSLATEDVSVTLRETGTGEIVIGNVTVVDTNTVTVTSGVAYNSGDIRVVVMG